jgi:hypothetical protein
MLTREPEVIPEDKNNARNGTTRKRVRADGARSASAEA